ncbi:NrfD/PsrC family molybdoenzyme membrane anchor subunit [Candidatus Electronema sp. JM]|uniref:NrfD/PsrC family molybdoenzyme membrane anchor subunit n=1 Tax=Candidatus Electronema sp. JM TaxID=3401571 RepID=UPI003AA94902
MTTYQTSAAKPSFLSAGIILLLIIAVIGAGAAAWRLIGGLGATTNLSDQVPWGLWVALDVLTGVALAAGGFTLAAAVHVFNLKEWKPLTRPAVLSAFIGYLMVCIGLLLDIGKPQAFWHPLVMWQPHSMLFEVICCTMTYTAVLAVEFKPTFLEGIGWTRLAKMMQAKAVVIPLAILAATLSFFHQSSLGGLFLLMKGRLNDLWWTTMLPWNFLLSAVAVGLAMTSVEAILSGWALKHPVSLKLLRQLAKGTAYALAVYAAVRLLDLLLKGNIGLALAGDQASKHFLLEVAGGALLPMLLLFTLARNEGSILFAQLLVIAGVVLNRFNVLWLTQLEGSKTYLPSVTELAVSLGLIAGAILLFKAAAVYLPVFTPAKS